jgi:hypothetical protein
MSLQGSTPLGEVALRYVASAPIVVIGPASRRQYRFSKTERVQRVARVDAEGLIASGHFKRAN